MLSALLPATYTGCFPVRGNVERVFFSSTCDSETALRATARCAASPISERWVRSVRGCSNSPSWNFLVRIRETASSMRDIGTSPFCTSAVSVDSKVSKFCGCMNMSTPALTLVATCWANVSTPGLMWSMPL